LVEEVFGGRLDDVEEVGSVVEDVVEAGSVLVDEEAGSEVVDVEEAGSVVEDVVEAGSVEVDEDFSHGSCLLSVDGPHEVDDVANLVFVSLPLLLHESGFSWQNWE